MGTQVGSLPKETLAKLGEMTVEELEAIKDLPVEFQKMVERCCSCGHFAAVTNRELPAVIRKGTLFTEAVHDLETAENLWNAIHTICDECWDKMQEEISEATEEIQRKYKVVTLTFGENKILITGALKV